MATGKINQITDARQRSEAPFVKISTPGPPEGAAERPAELWHFDTEFGHSQTLNGSTAVRQPTNFLTPKLQEFVVERGRRADNKVQPGSKRRLPVSGPRKTHRCARPGKPPFASRSAHRRSGVAPSHPERRSVKGADALPFPKEGVFSTKSSHLPGTWRFSATPIFLPHRPRKTETHRIRGATPSYYHGFILFTYSTLA